MPTARESVVYDVHDFKVWPLTSDAGGDASPVYGAAVDVPGIAEVSMDPNFVTAELKGDGKIIAKKGRVDKFNFSTTYGKIALDALVTFLGGAVTEDGDTSVQWSLPASNSLPYFKAAFRIADADVGDIHVIAHKCQLTGGSLLSQSSDEFGQPTADFEAIPANNDSFFVDFIFYSDETELE